MFKYISLTFHMLKSDLLSAMEYRASFIFQMLATILNDVMILSVWFLFFSTFKTVRGWTLQDSILIFSISEAVISLVNIFASGVLRIAESVANGELDYYLALPKNPLWHILVSKSDTSSLGDLVVAIAAFFLSGYVNFAHAILYVLIVIMATLTFISINIIIQSISFFLGNFSDAADQYYWLMVRIQGYPQIFFGSLKIIILTAVPTFFITALPVNVIRYTSFRYLYILVVVCALLIFLANWIFKKGLRRYESGNLINLRV
jgi:ABC-2 type transport system permease protein